MASTIRDVALRAGVSAATVSRVVNASPHPVREQTRRRVLRAVRLLGYQPNPVARGLRNGTSQTVALVVPDIENPFFPAIARGVEAVATRRGYAVVLCNTDGDRARERACLAILQRRRVDGVIVAAAGGGRHLQLLRRAGIPVVVVAREVPDGPVDAVVVDNVTGTRLATEHLLRLGHRRIAYIGGPPHLSVSRQRLRGFREALRVFGIRPDPDLITAGDFRAQGGGAAVRTLLARGRTFSALVAANDLTAIGAMEALRAAGRRIPADVAVVGFDDISFAALVSPPLTTVVQPAAQMGAAAMERILVLMAGRPAQDRRIILTPTLVVRSSCGARIRRRGRKEEPS